MHNPFWNICGTSFGAGRVHIVATQCMCGDASAVDWLCHAVIACCLLPSTRGLQQRSTTPAPSYDYALHDPAVHTVQGWPVQAPELQLPGPAGQPRVPTGAGALPSVVSAPATARWRPCKRSACHQAVGAPLPEQLRSAGRAHQQQQVPAACQRLPFSCADSCCLWSPRLICCCCFRLIADAAWAIRAPGATACCSPW